MFTKLNSEQANAIKYGHFYCSACAKSYERKELSIIISGDETYLNCPRCTTNIDVEYTDDYE